MAKKNKKQSNTEYTIALAGNPNVGKSTVFNCLTGLHQHTGNWAGKTVGNARGRYCFENTDYVLVDLPGTYSLFSHSFEEECAEELLSFGEYNGVVVVADANCLERNLNLALQILQITDNVILAVNLMDEAEKNGVQIDFEYLRNSLHIPVVPMSAGRKKGLHDLKNAIADLCRNPKPKSENPIKLPEIQKNIDYLTSVLKKFTGDEPRNPYYALRLIFDGKYSQKLFENKAVENEKALLSAAERTRNIVYSKFASKEDFCDYLTHSLVTRAEETAQNCVICTESKYKKHNELLDRIFMGKTTGTVTMLLLLLLILWITIYGANYPSQWLSNLLLGFESTLAEWILDLGASPILVDLVVHGGYKVLAWVVSVMLPPMAIFFPLFTLLEDFGYLPRVAFNLDRYLKKANTCGKQALTMCMGFGCNAVGVTGCRIIDSPRERLIAILTNVFVPCNGRFPTLIVIITMFFLVTVSDFAGSVLSSVLLCAVILLGIFMTFAVSKLLSKTILKGMPSSFTLELPPFRKPQIAKTLVRSIFDRTLFVLGRAVVVAAPAGIVIWLLANITSGDKTLLAYFTDFLDPLGRLMGLDGIILGAFILGFPANEIVLPIIIMAYLNMGTLTDYSSLFELRELLVANGWTITTALCTIIFSLMHWPCSTTLLTVKKETKSLKWTAAAFLIPTLCGMGICIIINLISHLFVDIISIF